MMLYNIYIVFHVYLVAFITNSLLGNIISACTIKANVHLNLNVAYQFFIFNTKYFQIRLVSEKFYKNSEEFYKIFPGESSANKEYILQEKYFYIRIRVFMGMTFFGQIFGFP